MVSNIEGTPQPMTPENNSDFTSFNGYDTYPMHVYNLHSNVMSHPNTMNARADSNRMTQCDYTL